MVYSFLFDTISKLIGNSISVSENTLIADLNLDSISMINLIIDIEENFSFEFDDEKLSFNCFITMEDLAQYIAMKTGIS